MKQHNHMELQTLLLLNTWLVFQNRIVDARHNVFDVVATHSAVMALCSVVVGKSSAY